MHTQILAFTQARGLPPSLAPELQSFIVDLARSGALSVAIPTLDGAVEDRAPVSLGASASPSVPAPASGDRIAGRYDDLGVIGTGGMGEVRRVRDVELNRTMAMKTLHAPMVGRPAALARFLDEAQATAQLQHPNIVPVYDIGRLPDGRFWFTMREVHGRTLGEVVDEVYAVSVHAWETGAQGWTFRRVMSAFLSVCRAVAYAHERGVVHRDLKPSNAMIGSLGEVYVLDWGLAKIVGRADLAADEGELDVVQTSRGSSDEHRTQMGRVVGWVRRRSCRRSRRGGRWTRSTRAATCTRSARCCTRSCRVERRTRERVLTRCCTRCCRVHRCRWVRLRRR